MRAFIRTEYGSPDVLELIDVPIPTPGAGEVLVRVVASSVNMADVDYLLGRPSIARLGTGLRRPRNPRLGLDVAGEVEAVGANVTHFGAGDEVFGDLTAYGFGGFAEFACAPEAAFALKPPNMTFEEAAAVPQAAVMAIQGICGKRPIRKGDQVLINGAGGNIGPYAVQIAKALGAEVTAVDGINKLEMLRRIGADHVIDYRTVDYTENGLRYDRIFDIAALHSILASRRSLNRNGIYVMVPGTIPGLFRAMFIAPLISMFGSRKMSMLAWKPFRPEDVASLKELIASGDLKSIIDRTFPFSRIPEALEYQQHGHPQGKITIQL